MLLMVVRKVYLKLRLFFYSIRNLANTALVDIMLFVLFAFVLNYVVSDRLIFNQANNDMLSGKYESAANLYNLSYAYYSLIHFTPANKEIYFAIPYKRAICYLKNHEPQKSIDSMSSGLTSIQHQYGVFSTENAEFTRKYLIEYYIDNHKLGLAENEFKNLVKIYKQIGYSQSEMTDMIRLSGDLYYTEGKHDVAIKLYKQAYKAISQEKDIDYEIYAKIVTRIAKYEIQNHDSGNALLIYKDAVTLLRNSGKKQNEITANIRLLHKSSIKK